MVVSTGSGVCITVLPILSPVVKRLRNNPDEEDTKMLEVTNECGISDQDVKDFTCLH